MVWKAEEKAYHPDESFPKPLGAARLGDQWAPPRYKKSLCCLLCLTLPHARHTCPNLNFKWKMRRQRRVRVASIMGLSCTYHVHMGYEDPNALAAGLVTFYLGSLALQMLCGGIACWLPICLSHQCPVHFRVSTLASTWPPSATLRKLSLTQML